MYLVVGRVNVAVSLSFRIVWHPILDYYIGRIIFYMALHINFSSPTKNVIIILFHYALTFMSRCLHNRHTCFFFRVRNSRAWIILIYRLWRFAVHQNFLNDFHLDCFLLTKVTVKWSLKHNTTSVKKQLVKQGTTFYQVSWIVWRWWEIWTKVIMDYNRFATERGKRKYQRHYTSIPLDCSVYIATQLKFK